MSQDIAVLVICVAALIVAVVGTALLRRYALARSVLDIPNARSSHSVPTPRGGGVAIVVAFLVGTLALWALRCIDSPLALAVGGAGALVAVVGFVDDHQHIPARWRLLAHCGAAAWALYWLGGVTLFGVAGSAPAVRLVDDLLGLFALVWLLNLYNFMDGIDGIAGVEAVSVCLGAIVVYAMKQSPMIAWHAPALLLAASLGFLVWNYPPAKIFMGDAGSGFLGLMLGLLAVDAARHSPELLWSWTILLGAFVVDATVTLLFRLSRGERLYEAHRSHAYQHASQRRGAHRPVTVTVGLINFAWLLPLASLVGVGRLSAGAGVVVAYVPLVGLALYFNAGRVDVR